MFGNMKPLNLDKVTMFSPYEVTMAISPNIYRFMTEYGVDIAISFDLDDILEQSEAYMFNINNVNRRKSPRD